MKNKIIIFLCFLIYINIQAQNTATAVPVCDGAEGEITFMIDSDIFNDLSKPFTVKYAPTGTYDFDYRFFDTNLSTGSFTDVPLGTYDVYLPTSDNCLELITVELISYPDVSITSAIEHPLMSLQCQNGAIDLTITGGMPPWDVSWYEYDWDNGTSTLIQQNTNVMGMNDGEDISSLMPGRYLVSFTDPVCGFQQKYFTLGLSYLTENAISSHITNAHLTYCDNGSIEISLNEGIEPFEYYWTFDDGNGHNFYSSDEDIYQLRNYEYCLTVTDSQCGTVSECYNIDCCSLLEVDAEVNNATGYSCDDGCIDISVLNGAGPYNYYWTVDDGGGHRYYSSLEDINQLRNYEYCVTVTDSECALGTFCEEINCCIDPPTFNVTNAYCNNNGSITVNWHGQGGNRNYNISWNGPNGPIGGDNIYNLTSGIYTAYIENQECFYLKEFDIEGAPLTYKTVDIKNPTCIGFADDGEIEIEVNTPYPFEVHWYAMQGGYPSGNSIGTGLHIMGLGSGDYLAEVTVNGECSVYLYARLYCCNVVVVAGKPYNPHYVEVRNYVVPKITDVGISYVSSEGVCDGSIIFETNQHHSHPFLIKYYEEPSGQEINSLTNLCEGTYCIEMNNGCSDPVVECFEVEVCQDIAIDLDDIQHTCEGTAYGAIQVSVSGGNNPYHYSWSNGRTGQMIDRLGVVV